MNLKARIRKKLRNYRVPLNIIDGDLPEKLPGERNVAVIGGGIAGISAAANLAERGFGVDLYERETFLGGKAGSWTFHSNGEELRTEHGFHAFFRQYYNLRAFMEKTGSLQNLIPIDDYVILYDKDKRQGFRDLEPTPGLNILSLRKYGIYGLGTFINPLSMPFISLLRFDPERTFRKFDRESFAQFSKRTRMPAGMKLVFNSFSRAFFAEPGDMSMAELIKSFHFYFLSNDLGLLYDVLNDDFETSFIRYCREFIERHGGKIRLGQAVDEIVKTDSGFSINGKHYDYTVLCTDVKATRQIVKRSESLARYENTYKKLTSLKSSGFYAVYRLWTDRFESAGELPFFIFTDRLRCLDSVTFYHKMEKASAEWSQINGGGIFELHSYIVPANMGSEKEVKASLLEEFYHYFPEMKGMAIRHEYFQYRNDFPGFHTGEHANRPTVNTEIPGMYLAGDWVKMNNCTMLMEAAYTSGALAANAIMTDAGLRENELHSVPLKGLLA